MSLGNIISQLRKEKGMSQEELAEKCEVSRQAVTKWECEESIPSLEKLCLLADIFGTSIDVLVGRKGRTVDDEIDIINEKIRKVNEEGKYNIFNTLLTLVLPHVGEPMPEEQTMEYLKILKWRVDEYIDDHE